ncbi:MAG TPA: hypothetical protein VMB25_22540 [Bryobacteraceae bacterium]|nr:hypothetical protein [Bryobacteraceae bacterium]
MKIARIAVTATSTLLPPLAAPVQEFHPAIAYPYHDRGSALNAFKKGLEGSGVEVRILDWYAD